MTEQRIIIVTILLVLFVGCGTVEQIPCTVEWHLKSGESFIVDALHPPCQMEGIWRIEMADGMYIRVPDALIADMKWTKEPDND